MLAELARREKDANIKPDPDVDIYMKAAATAGQEASVTLSLHNSVKIMPGTEQHLAHVKVPDWEEKYGKEAACRLSDYILHGKKEFKAIVEEKDNSGGEVYSTGTNHIEGFARLDKSGQEDESVTQTIDKLKAYQNEARKARRGIWKNGDLNSDDEEERKISS